MTRHTPTPDVSDAIIEYDGKIQCPNCRDGWLTQVLDSRPGTLLDMPSVRRRRVCNTCGVRSTTYEIVNEVFEHMFRTQNAKQAFAMKIVDMINDEVRAELSKRLDHGYRGTDVDRH